jgi:hypothetical protein
VAEAIVRAIQTDMGPDMVISSRLLPIAEGLEETRAEAEETEVASPA